MKYITFSTCNCLCLLLYVMYREEKNESLGRNKMENMTLKVEYEVCEYTGKKKKVIVLVADELNKKVIKGEA